MNKILTPEEKLEIISLITTSRTKDELEVSINNYFKKEVKEEISIMPNKEIEPPIEIKKDSPFDASIYNSKYIYNTKKIKKILFNFIFVFDNVLLYFIILILLVILF